MVGLDIIGLGDFRLRREAGETVFSFRIAVGAD
jgi:hypothetical protein